MPDALANHLERLKECSRALSDADDRARGERERRDQLIREAIDGGESIKAVAHAAGLSTSRVMAILGTAA